MTTKKNNKFHGSLIPVTTMGSFIPSYSLPSSSSSSSSSSSASSEPQTLEEAIILQAVEDWRKSYRFLHSLTPEQTTELSKTARGRHKIQAAKEQLEECEIFFKSEWFEELSPMELEGENFLKRLVKFEEER